MTRHTAVGVWSEKEESKGLPCTPLSFKLKILRLIVSLRPP
jgi:hypothetical protein